jgi:hypothetical protein
MSMQRKSRRLTFVRGAVAAAALALTTGLFTPRPAHAVLDAWMALKIIGAIQTAISFTQNANALLGESGPSVVQAIQEVQAEILEELRAVRNDEVKARAEGCLWTFRELVENPNHELAPQRLAQLLNDSAFVLAEMETVLTMRDLPSMYTLAPTYNLLVGIRAMALRHAGYPPSTINRLFAESKDVNHRVVGARNFRLDQCFLGLCTISTSLSSRLYEKMANYWFKVPANPFCSCNVWENRCKPTGAEGRCIVDYTPLIPPERERVIGRMDQDAVVQVSRAALAGFVSLGHNRATSVLGDGTIVGI